MFASNMSFEEILNYSDIPETIRCAIDDMLETIAKHEKEIERLNRSDELTNEQVCFARELIENIDHCVKSDLPDRKTGAIADFRKAYAMVRENTYFET